MTVRNRIKEFLDQRPDPVTGKSGTSAYRFWKETSLSRPTAYRLVADPTYIPSGDVLDKICSTYHVQPGELLVWFAGEDTEQEFNLEQGELIEKTRQVREEAENISMQRRKQTNSFLTVVAEVAESA